MKADFSTTIMAMQKALAASGNYVADDEVYPTSVRFNNGRTVSIAFEHGKPFLRVESERPADGVSNDT